MAFKPVVGKPGVFRHDVSGFIVHRARGLQDILDANGFMCERSDGLVHWMVGRDMRDYIAANGIKTKLELVTSLSRHLAQIGEAIIWGKRSECIVRFPLECRPTGLVLTSKGYAGNLQENLAKWPASATWQLFALVSNCQAGRGRWGGHYTADSQAGYAYDWQWVIRPEGMAGAGLSVPRPGVSGPSSQFVRCSNEHLLAGTAVVAVPLGVTWEGFLANVGQTLEHADKSEVQRKWAEATAAVLPKLKTACPLPLIYVPIEILRDGTCCVVPPKPWIEYVTDKRYTTLPNSYAPVMRGGTVFDESGVLQTNATWVVNQSYVKDPGDSLFCWTRNESHGGNNVAANWSQAGLADPATKIMPLDDCPRVTSIDGVRLERILGGLSGRVMADAKEATIVEKFPMTSAQLVNMWRTALRFTSSSASLRRGVDGNGVPESDALYQSRLEGYATSSDPESPLATRLTQWDTHGFSAGHGLMAALCELDGGKTDAAWMTCLWPQRVAKGASWTCAQTGTYSSVAVTTFANGPVLK